MRFDRIAVLDWSAAAGRNTGRNSIWLAVAGAGDLHISNLPIREQAETTLQTIISSTLAAEQRLLIGVDVAFGYPAGFARALTGRAEALAVWDWLAARVQDDAKARSNHPQVAAAINATLGGAADAGPFWGSSAPLQAAGLPPRRPASLPAGLASHRAADRAVQGGKAQPKSVWQLAGAGVVGAQVLTALPVLARLRAAFPGQIAVWPFDAPTAPVVLAEVYPALIDAAVAEARAADPDAVPDALQVRLLAEALQRLVATDTLAAMLATPPPGPVEEGCILGTGHLPALRAAASPALPPLRNDCFALPPGASLVTVDSALDRLRAALTPVTWTEVLPIATAAGRILAHPLTARRAHPPAANAAVDGYGMASAGLGDGPHRLPLAPGRAAAGQPFAGPLPAGTAVRILTGASIPDGVDAVVMQEDVTVEGATIAFSGPVRPGANIRPAGEDVTTGSPILPAGRCLRPQDLGLAASSGVARATVWRRLRVAVLSTGDEVLPDPAAPAADHQIFDANRPMLLALVARWGCDAVDLGHAGDDAGAILTRLRDGAARADVILTSGGASAGDEDHVSALLRQHAELTSWRLAMKPGRPLALALWPGPDGRRVPVMGLPGNPVAAFVCALIFARPALSALSGAGWVEPEVRTVPAAFAKRKKAGRREFLRARLNAEGAAEVFPSEGSGRVSGLVWAEGLVDLPDDAREVAPGDPVRYLPFAGFGL